MRVDVIALVVFTQPFSLLAVSSIENDFMNASFLIDLLFSKESVSR